MKGTKSEYNYLNKEMDKKYKPVHHEWAYMEAEQRAREIRAQRNRRFQRFILGACLIIVSVLLFLSKIFFEG